MKLFLQTSHKAVVFLLFITVWTDVILPTPYKNSDLAFWIFGMLYLTWFFFAFKVLNKLEYSAAARFKLYFYGALLLLAVGLFLDWILGFDTNYIGNVSIGAWKGWLYFFVVFVLTKLLLKAEQVDFRSWRAFYTFIMILVLPIGAWWVHQRLQKVAHASPWQVADNNQ